MRARFRSALVVTFLVALAASATAGPVAEPSAPAHRVLRVHLSPKQTHATFTVSIENPLPRVVAIEGVQQSEELRVMNQAWQIRPKGTAQLEVECDFPRESRFAEYMIRIGTNAGEKIYLVEMTREPKRTISSIDEVARGMPIECVSAR